MVRSFVAAGIATIALAGAADAATITVSATFNPAVLNPFVPNVVDVDLVTLGTGDTLDLTIDFIGGPVTIGAGSAVWFGLLAQSGGDSVDTSSTLTFTGNSANLPAIIGPLGQVNEFIHLGSYFAGFAVGDYSFLTANQLLDVIDAPAGPRNYAQAFFYFETTIRSVIPEPATWGLMIAGFGLVGAAFRRRAAIAA